MSLKNLNAEREQELPGPGSYQVETGVSNIRQKAFGKNGVFGSTERRFVDTENLQTPGPGQYNNSSM